MVLQFLLHRTLEYIALDYYSLYIKRREKTLVYV